MRVFLPKPRDCEILISVASSSLSNKLVSQMLSCICASFNCCCRPYLLGTSRWDENLFNYSLKLSWPSIAFLSLSSYSWDDCMFFATSIFNREFSDSWSYDLLTIEWMVCSNSSFYLWSILFFSIYVLVISARSFFICCSFSFCYLNILESASILWSLDLIECSRS